MRLAELQTAGDESRETRKCLRGPSHAPLSTIEYREDRL